jgi:hypothetical protein
MAFFNSNPGTGGNPSNFLDGTDAYANNNRTVVSFLHIPSDKRVSFKAMITTFSDSFTSQWSGEDVYGRGDPIQIFKSTKRSITLGFDVVASTDNEAYQNLARIQELSQFTYPSYTGVEAQTIAQAPLVRVGFMNIITDNDGNVVSGNSNDVVSETGQTFRNADRTVIPVEYDNKSENGLVCAITSLNYSSMGFEKDNSNTVIGKGMALPRVINVSLSLEPLHRHQLGWLGSDFSKNNFPYGIGKKSEAIHGNKEPKRQNIDKSKYELGDAKDIYGESITAPTMAAATKRAASTSDIGSGHAEIALAPYVQPSPFDEIENIESGVDYLNNRVIGNLNKRQLEKQGTQQQIDMANARYNSLGGQIRYNRDKRIANSALPYGTTARQERAKQNIDASGQTLSDFDQPIDIGYSPTRGDYS